MNTPNSTALTHAARALSLAALTALLFSCGSDPEPIVRAPLPPVEQAPTLTPEIDADALGDALGVVCASGPADADIRGATHTIPFTIPPGHASAIFTPLATAGIVELLAIDTPVARLDVSSDYRHHNIRVESIQGGALDAAPSVYGDYTFDWAVMLPYAPSYRDSVTPGDYVAHVSSTEDPCHYVIAREAPDPGAVSLNIYFVGLTGLDVARAPDDEDLADVLTRVDALLSKADVRLGTIRYFDAPEEVARRYSVIRNADALEGLTGQGIGLAGGLDANLSVDVFFVRSLSTGGAVGLSGGLPGPPGMHGNPLNGLVFETSDLGFDNGYIAHIMAHELGHYLGLRHTTEIVRGLGTDIEVFYEDKLGTTDPLTDTVECADPINMGYDCPDADNLMFPAAPIPGMAVEPTLTPEQGQVLRWNPLVR